MSDELFGVVLSIVSSLFTVVLIPLLYKLISAHVDNVTLKGVLTRLTFETGNVVREVEQAVKDGGPAKKKAAVAKLKENLGPAGLKRLANVLGGNPESIAGSAIEAAVHELPSTQAKALAPKA